jgi:hypothetical protein
MQLQSIGQQDCQPLYLALEKKGTIYGVKTAIAKRQKPIGLIIYIRGKTMNKKAMEHLIEKTIFPEIRKIRDEGQKEYARDTKDVLANFRRLSAWLDMSVGKVIGVYLLKHIDGIMSWVDGHRSQREDVRGRLCDVIVYCCLLWSHIEEEEMKNK